jgi:DUF4097 and DUF4098 domain-containing protein YvlB
MQAKLLTPLLAGALLALCGCEYEDWGGVSRSEDFHYNYPLKSGGRVSIEGFNGSVEVSGWDQETVDISGTKHASSDDSLAAIKLDTSNGPDYVSVRALRPSSMHGNNGIKFIVKVPRKAMLDRIVSSNGSVRVIDVEGPVRLKTSNGPIRTQNVRGEIEAQTSNGPIELNAHEGNARVRTSNGPVRAQDLRGSIEATTSNGSIHIGLAHADASRPIRLETSNGGVELTLPPDARNDVRVSTNNSGITIHAPGGLNARVMAKTSNSRISSDFEVRTHGEQDKHRMDGTIGSGGPLLDLTTSNGSIKLVKM